MEDLRVLCHQITALGGDAIPPAVLEEMAGVTLLHAEGIVNTVRVPARGAGRHPARAHGESVFL